MLKRYVALLLAMMLLLAGCSADSSDETVDTRPYVGICLPDKTWESEATLLSAPLTSAGYRVEVVYANGDPQVQQFQLQTMLSQSADLLILCAIDSLPLLEQVQQAKEANIPVLAYDRMLMHSDGVSACITMDTFSAGKKLGQYITENAQLESRETTAYIELFMGSPEDNNAYLFHSGLMTVLQPYFEKGVLTTRSGRTAFDDTCVQNANPFTARSYLLDYLLESYEDTLPDIICTGGIGMAQACTDTYPEETSQFPLLVGIGETDSAEPFDAYAAFDRTELANACVRWAKLLLEDPESLPKDTTQNNGTIDVPTFLLNPTFVK